MKQNTIIEVRSHINDNIVIQFNAPEDAQVNVISAGFERICKALRINRVQAESQYYVTRA